MKGRLQECADSPDVIAEVRRLYEESVAVLPFTVGFERSALVSELFDTVTLLDARVKRESSATLSLKALTQVRCAFEALIKQDRGSSEYTRSELIASNCA